MVGNWEVNFWLARNLAMEALYTRLIALRGTDLYALRIRPAHPGLRGGARSGLLEFADMFVTFGDARLHPKRAIKLFRLLPELACKFQIAMCFV